MPNREFAKSDLGLYRARIVSKAFVMVETENHPDCFGEELESPMDVLFRASCDDLIAWGNTEVIFEPINAGDELDDDEKVMWALGEGPIAPVGDLVSKNLVEAEYERLKVDMLQAQRDLHAFEEKFPHVVK